MSESESNYINIGSGHFVVRTQSGFKQAYKAWLRIRQEEYASYEFAREASFPEAFPSVVSFSLFYEGIDRVWVKHEHVNAFRARMADLMRRLDDADPPSALPPA
ncbi:hypothetical protein [Rhizobium sp. RU36D]|uniref:hypothetical protein n=1 Tax=Rhizobium sp. RU36D TaxID=1907415 RepID=UPI0009D81069|nr:hypothetical protein [Rhizobium sp. RU36D]SMD20347.1 hypothetical protein SAMN05880593_15311 [Rhizobium sp. RU36D]